MPVILIGTLDTKGDEIAFARDVIRAEGLETLVIDVGSSLATGGKSSLFTPEVSCNDVFRAAGTSIAEIHRTRDRGEAVAAAARGVVVLINKLFAQGQVQGVLGLGGSAGTVIATAAMRALPFGIPKVMVSTLASGQTRPFVGGSDIAMFYPVADLAGLNRLTVVALRNAARATAGMIMPRPGVMSEVVEPCPLVAATMFGVTTPCVDVARRTLESAGLEVVVFHATGVGGQSMEGLVRDGRIAGLLDLTTTELADELVGGILSAGPDRMEAAVRAGIPQVVSVGALDMVNFGPADTVPDRFAARLFHAHNPSVTLMRTTAAENAMLGALIARVLGASTTPAVLMLPLRGVSALDAPGMPFHDPDADRALFDALTHGLKGHPFIRLDVRDEHINDPAFAAAAADNLLGLLDLPITR